MGSPLPVCLVTLLLLCGAEKTYQQDLPSPLLAYGPDTAHNAIAVDGNWINIQLNQPFHYFGRIYTQLYMSMDGFLSFSPQNYDGYAQVSNIDIIAPLWTDVDIYTRGDISYEQATNGSLLDSVTNEMNRMYPGFFATWVFVGTWAKVEFEPDTGEVTFQVVLVSDDAGQTFILMNYGPIPSDPEAWMAGYQTQENNNFNIQPPNGNITNLSQSSNVYISGRWAFQVDGAQYVPTTLFPVPALAIRPNFYDGGYVQVQLSHPFIFFGSSQSSLFFNMDGFLSFQSINVDNYIPNQNIDLIAPLWSDIDTYNRGVITYAEVTDGHLLRKASHEINRIYPGSDFTATWVFVGTWDKVEFEPDTGPVTFQVVLISDDEGHSYALLNYGAIPNDPESWMAGFQTQGHTNQYSIQVASTSALTTSTNVGTPGRWAFKVNEPTELFFPVLSSAVQHAVTSDGAYTLVQLSQPFSYFGKSHSSLYLSMDGFLSFEPLFYDGYVPNQNKDIIAPLWTDIDTYTRGNISYEQATDGPLIKLASQEINRMFPGSQFIPSWVFVATWEKVEFEPDLGEVTFQVILISGGDEDDASFILMNYGSMPEDPEGWMAGYQTAGNKYHYRIQASGTSQLSKTTNVGIPGRWAFHVDACSSLSCTASEQCLARTGLFGCACADNNPRVNAKTFDSHEFCNSSSGQLSLSRCQLFEAGFPAEFLHLNDARCGGQFQNDRVVFAFDSAANICGTTMKNNATHFIYENSVQMTNGDGSSVISRDSWLNIDFSCVFPLVRTISMPMTIHATGSVVHKTLPGTESTYQIRLVPYMDDSFTVPYSGNVTIEVNQQVFVAVEVDGVDSQTFSTVLDSCWATPYDNINYPMRWDLVVNECPNENDGTVQVLQNGVSTSSHFSFSMFTFTGLSDNIFMHCQVHLCLVASGQCAQPCEDEDEGDIRVRRRRSVDFHDKASISMGF